MNEQNQRCLEARKRRNAWLLRQSNDYRSPGPVDQGFCCDRLPRSFTVSGETHDGIRICDWVRVNAFAATGDFVGVSTRGVEKYTYENSTFINGDQLLRQNDLAHMGPQHLLTLRQEESSGFCHRPDGTGIGRDENIPTVAHAGKPALMLLSALPVDERTALSRWTVCFGDYYVDTQHDNGHCDNRTPLPTMNYNITNTADFIVHLDTLIGALSLDECPVSAVGS